MAKSHKKTRKASKQTRKSHTGVLTIPELRKAFDHMDKVVENLRGTSKHSFSDAVVVYRGEWRKIFKRDLSPADAEAYLKFRFGLKKAGTAKSRGFTRRSKMRGGAALPLTGAPLQYTTQPGSTGVYGNFPTYQTQGLDRYYGSAINADCGKPNGFPTDGSAASQRGGGFEGMFRPLLAGNPPHVLHDAMMAFKGAAPFPSPDPVGTAPVVTTPTNFVSTANLTSHARTFTNDMAR